MLSVEPHLCGLPHSGTVSSVGWLWYLLALTRPRVCVCVCVCVWARGSLTAHKQCRSLRAWSRMLCYVAKMFGQDWKHEAQAFCGVRWGWGSGSVGRWRWSPLGAWWSWKLVWSCGLVVACTHNDRKLVQQPASSPTPLPLPWSHCEHTVYTSILRHCHPSVAAPLPCPDTAPVIPHQLYTNSATTTARHREHTIVLDSTSPLTSYTHQSCLLTYQTHQLIKSNQGSLCFGNLIQLRCFTPWNLPVSSYMIVGLLVQN